MYVFKIEDENVTTTELKESSVMNSLYDSTTSLKPMKYLCLKGFDSWLNGVVCMI